MKGIQNDPLTDLKSLCGQIFGMETGHSKKPENEKQKAITNRHQKIQRPNSRITKLCVPKA